MSEVITFYSYKGGVGRTMALANVSVVLAKWGHKVLVVDWDLEAPGLEHFYKDYLEDIHIVGTKSGVIDLLQGDENNNWKDAVIPISMPQTDVPIHLISSGRRDEHYFKKVRSFDVDTFYENNGGDVIERLRNEWLDSYDYVLIDSRTGITEIGGICTIQLPDTVVMLFTATDQGFDGVLDIIKRAGAAQQKLSYDRQKLIFLPIPSKFETNTEFKLSQEWLIKFASNLEDTYNDWLPVSVGTKEFLELTKIPYISYFSFGEKLPVIEQGVNDPSGLGYAYETLAALIANHLNNVGRLINNRDEYIAEVNKNPFLAIDLKKNGNGNIKKKLNLLKQKLSVSDEVIVTEKNKETIVSCIQNSILPLLEMISVEMNNIGSLFKKKNEAIKIFGEYSFFDSGRNQAVQHESTSTLPELAIRVQKAYSDFQNNDFEINSISYSCIFNKLRNFQKDTLLIVRLDIEFHDVVFEIRSKEGNVNIDKLYHETLSGNDIETISASIVAYLLEKIESALNE